MASNPDLVIRGGNVADGLGSDLFEADVAIADGRISEVGKVLGKGKLENRRPRQTGGAGLCRHSHPL
jgi:N-acyl-D-aspartate/D-glutamate deacylase